jgi:hypothetical protein
MKLNTGVKVLFAALASCSLWLAGCAKPTTPAPPVKKPGAATVPEQSEPSDAKPGELKTPPAEGGSEGGVATPPVGDEPEPAAKPADEAKPEEGKPEEAKPEEAKPEEAAADAPVKPEAPAKPEADSAN